MHKSIPAFVLLLILAQSCATIFPKPDKQFPDNHTKSFDEAPLPVSDVTGTFYQNVPYGKYTRNVFDLLVPNSDTPVPLVIYIHGGGFLHGSKEGAYSADNGEDTPYDTYFTTLLQNGIAVASINYRFLERKDTAGVMKCMQDGKRCLQFIRYHAAEYNIDPQNIQLTGNSAGAGMAFWLGLQDDMADTDSKDPVLRQSTRVKSIAVIATQSTYDLDKWATDILAEYNPKGKNINKAYVGNPLVRPFLKHMMFSFYGIRSKKAMYSDACKQYRQEVDFLEFLSADDPEIYLENISVPYEKPRNFNAMFHHAYHARALHRQADSVGVETVCHYHGYEDVSEEFFTDFLIRKAGE